MRAKKPPVIDRGLNEWCSLDQTRLCGRFEDAFTLGGHEPHLDDAVVGLGLHAVYDRADDSNADAAE